MNTESKQLPLPQPAAGLPTKASGTIPVIRRMAEGVLASRQRMRFKIGEFELCEPDYRLIQVWAESLAMSPQMLLMTLAECRFERYDVDPISISFVLEEGALKSLVWDFDRLPEFPDLWVDGLHLHTLGFVWDKRTPNRTLAPNLPSLRKLVISRSDWIPIKLQTPGKLELVGVPHLVELVCLHFRLTELDLSPVPNLTKLDCWGNQLIELDLSPVPNLTELSCAGNQLTELDLSPVPNLTYLGCGGNRLTELDLSPVPNLTYLGCWGNQLTELDLSPVPNMTYLGCGGNRLTELDLSPVSNLTILYCDENLLTELDLSPVPNLTRLYCHGNRLTELDLSPVQSLKYLSCDKHLILHHAPPELEIIRL